MRKPDTPCAGCGKLLYTSPWSLPAGQRMCHACRRARPKAAKGTCVTCSGPIYGQAKIYCSRDCYSGRAGRPASARVGRTCEICGGQYRATYGEQRTCSRPCGVKLRRREGTLSRPYVLEALARRPGSTSVSARGAASSSSGVQPTTAHALLIAVAGLTGPSPPPLAASQSTPACAVPRSNRHVTSATPALLLPRSCGHSERGEPIGHASVASSENRTRSQR
jgi:hypothetical protein